MRFTRRKSYKKNVFTLVIGAIGIGFYFTTRAGIIRGVNLNYALLLLVISLIVTYAGLRGLALTRKTNRELANLPYRFDYEKELATHSIVGKRKKKAKNGAIRFSYYSEWKDYTENEYADLKGNVNFYHYLVRYLRDKKSYVELIKVFLIPIEIFLLTVAKDILGPYGASIVLLFLAIAIIVEYIKGKNEVDFLQDFIVVIFPDKIEEIGSIT